MYENLTGCISENTLSGRKNKIMNVIEKKKKKRFKKIKKNSKNVISFIPNLKELENIRKLLIVKHME